MHAKAIAFDREAVFVGSFKLDSRSSVINTEAGLYIESPELAKQLTVYMATGVVPANSYRVLLDPDGMIIWETVRDRQTVRYLDEPGTGFCRRSVADLFLSAFGPSQASEGRAPIPNSGRSRGCQGYALGLQLVDYVLQILDAARESVLVRSLLQ